MFDNIPREMRERKQWCLWKYIKDETKSKPTKVPLNPNGKPISTIDPTSWVAFEDAVKAASWFDGIGFVLSSNDPYSFIDLDTYDPKLSDADRARHTHIASSFTGYAEISPSGKGLHLIVKGKVPQGRRRAGVEIYSSERYFTMTGNVWREGPILEQPLLLNQLWEELAPPVNETNGKHYGFASQPESIDDWTICERASKAHNGAKFIALWQAKWQLDYPSQSEADFALIDIIAYYTDNAEQVARIFRQSGLGQRDKAKRSDYVNGMVKRSFDNKPPPIDFSHLASWLPGPLEPSKAPALSNPSPAPKEAPSASSIARPALYSSPEAQDDETQAVYSVPPGLLGEIATYIYSSAPRPVPEIALCAAMGLMAGITGRAYNINGTGLNQYILLLATTGVGKDAIANGISHLMTPVQKKVPEALQFLGPSEIRSDAALLKYISKRPSFVTISGEFGQSLSQMAAINAPSVMKGIKRVMLDLYGKSGQGAVLRPTIYSDSEKNTLLISSPAFSFIGESAPEPFYEAVDERLISDGLLPRFTLIEYRGKRQHLNPNANHPPDERLIERLSGLCAQSLMLNNANTALQVNLLPEAAALMADFDRECTDRINNDINRPVIAGLWNRAHLRALKLSALVGVGNNPYNPTIDVECARWAIRLSTHNTEKLLAKFEKGEVGANAQDSKQLNEVRRQIKLYFTQPFDQIDKYLESPKFYTNYLIPQHFLSRRLMCVSAFKNDRRGAIFALKNTIKELVDNGELFVVDKNEVFEKTGSRALSYALPNHDVVLRLIREGR